MMVSLLIMRMSFELFDAHFMFHKGYICFARINDFFLVCSGFSSML